MKKLIVFPVFLFFFSAVAALGAPKICIDPGHGGSDNGVSGNGVTEDAAVLNIAKKFRSMLNRDTKDSGGGYSWNVIMTRTSDTYVSLASRASYANANGANRFVSIHLNSFSDSSAHGAETYIYTNVGNTTVDLGDKIQFGLWFDLDLMDRGLKRANYHVLRETAMSAAMPVIGFVSNSSDAAKLRNSNFSQHAGASLMMAMQAHYGKHCYSPK